MTLHATFKEIKSTISTIAIDLSKNAAKEGGSDSPGHDRGGRGTRKFDHDSGKIMPNIKHQTSTIKHQTSNIKHQTSNIKHQTSNIKHQTSNIKQIQNGDRQDMVKQLQIAMPQETSWLKQRSEHEHNQMVHQR